MLIRASSGFGPGVTRVVDGSGAHRDMMQDLSVVVLPAGMRLSSDVPLERIWLLLAGRVRFRAGSAAFPAVERHSLLDEGPWALHVPAGTRVELEALTAAELTCHATTNPGSFPTRLFAPADASAEMRGEGTVDGAANRIVRTIIDDRNAPHAMLVLGEVVTLPGRWSSYPPHHHPQPEVYHYRVVPEQGFGLACVGEDAYVVRSGDTTLIGAGQVHPQVAAPGYALWYAWCVRHLEGSRYSVPRFVDEHAWTLDRSSPVWRPGSGPVS